MKTVKRLNFIMVLLFIAAISLPLVFADFKGGQVSVSENRYLATFPDVIKDGKLVFKPSEFDKWINDNVGGRSVAQEINAKTDYKLGKLHSGNVVEGKEGWLYLLGPDVLTEYVNVAVPSEEAAKMLVNGYENVARKLEARGIGFVVGMYPRKTDVYPEYMTDDLKKVGESSTFQVLSEALKQSEILNFVNPYDKLMAAKENRLTYSKAYDASHWNNFGAFIGYQCLMEQVQKVIPDIRILTEEDFVITEEVFETNKSNGYAASETDFVYQLKNNQTTQDISYLFDNGFNGKDQWQSYRYFRNIDSSLPKAVMVGDSFTWMFQLEYLSQSFSELAFIHYNDMDQLDWLINYIQPDIVITPFLSSAIWAAYAWEPAEEQKTQTTTGIKPIADHDEWGYQFVDYIGTTPSDGNVLTVNAGDATSYMEGWALDPLAGSVASKVVIQVGDRYYDAEYGKARDSVSSYFQNDAYLNSGYTINLNTQELIEAGQVAVHVISSDGSYQYPVSVYFIHVK